MADDTIVKNTDNNTGYLAIVCIMCAACSLIVPVLGAVFGVLAIAFSAAIVNMKGIESRNLALAGLILGVIGLKIQLTILLIALNIGLYVLMH
ncbi:hypothetical protein [Eubacterium xylanophilum]|uniref:hypothetical protein n=1 Tax=Eubacterium xylanophilum TaxID=39497 RepID=UPI0004790CEB|nr:hypothetical protein [Eubacterium xylanophilum]